LLFAFLFAHVNWQSQTAQTLPNEPLKTDISPEKSDRNTEGEFQKEVPAPMEAVSYKMALIGEQEAVSPDEAGFEETFSAGDYADTTFYAVSFAIQLDSAPGTEFQSIQAFDAVTGEDLTATSNSILHVYKGEIPSEEYITAHPVKSTPVISSAVSDEIITCIFVSLEKKELNDLKIILVRKGNELSGGEEVKVNCQLRDITTNPTYSMGSCLLKLGDQYYITESGTGIGAIPGENKYVTRKIRCASLPLTGSASGLNASLIAFFDKKTGGKVPLPEGAEPYYREDYVENQGLMVVAFGIQMAGGSYEESAAFLDAVLPGYNIDGQISML